MIVMVGTNILNMDHIVRLSLSGSSIWALNKNERYGNSRIYDGKDAAEVFADVQRQIRDQIGNVKSGN